MIDRLKFLIRVGMILAFILANKDITPANQEEEYHFRHTR
jgi:hypothetical protein